MTGRRFHTFLVLLSTSILLSSATLGEANRESRVLEPVYRIPLIVHLGGSGRPTEEWLPILEEINSIWLSQAGICFEIRTVNHNEASAQGFDLWFETTLPDWNGFYLDEHDMHVRDNPDLRPARRAAKSPAARTAAHELGHALQISHRQDSDDNLMRSKTYGMRLHADEVRTARRHAGKITLPETGLDRCGPIIAFDNR